MSPEATRSRIAPVAAFAALLLASIALVACGKKRPPLPPELAAVECPAGRTGYASGSFAQGRVLFLCLPKAIAEEPYLLRCDLESRPMICEDTGSFSFTRTESGRLLGGIPRKDEDLEGSSQLVVNFRNGPPRQPTFEEVETDWRFLLEDGRRLLPAGFTFVKGTLCDRTATVLGSGVCNLEARSASLYWHIAVHVRRPKGMPIAGEEYREELAFWLRHLGLLVTDPAK